MSCKTRKATDLAEMNQKMGKLQNMIYYKYTQKKNRSPMDFIIAHIKEIGIALCVIFGFVVIKKLFRGIVSGGKSAKSKKRFVALDFETANERYYSACALGIVVFENLKPKQRFSYLIKPPTKFKPENVAIHGITADAVKDAPSFDKIWKSVYPLLVGNEVAIYSDFDAKVMIELKKHFKLRAKHDSTINFVDVCELSRIKIHGLSDYKLPTVCEYLGIKGLNHHEATSDAEACGKIYAWMLANEGKAVEACSGIPATPRQKDYIRSLGGEVPIALSREDASRMIDELIEANKHRKEQQRQEIAEQKRAEAKLIKETNKQHDRRKREEDALTLLADEMNSPDYKERKSRSKRGQDLRELQILVNSVISDGVIEISELTEVKAWLLAHKVLDDDFAETLALIDATMSTGQPDENVALQIYCSLLDCLSALRNRRV